jgi:hypothetical protein
LTKLGDGEWSQSETFSMTIASGGVPSVAGIGFRDMGGDENHHIMVTCGGFARSLARTEAWTDLLIESHAETKTRGFRYLFAIKGPHSVGYSQGELRTSGVAQRILSLMQTDPEGQLVVISHSSGGFVCGDFLRQLRRDAAAAVTSPAPLVTEGRVSYLVLDGATTSVASLNSLHFFRAGGLFGVNAHDNTPGRRNTRSANWGIAATVAAAGGTSLTVEVTTNCPDRRDGGAGGIYCVHNALLCKRPYGNRGCPHSVAEMESSYLDSLPFN